MFATRRFDRLAAGLLLLLIPLFRLPTVESAEPAKNAPLAFVEVPIKEPIVFDKHVFPILEEKCLSCHDAEGGLAEADLDLMTVASILKGGKHGPAIVAGKGAESLLVRTSARLQKPFMPPKDEVPLTAVEVSILKAWVDAGAKPGQNQQPGESRRQAPVELGTLPPGVHPVYALDLHGASGLLAAGRANVVMLYDLPTQAERGMLEGHADIVQSVAISPDGQWLASGGFQKVLLWQVPKPRDLGTLADVKAVPRTAVASPDGKLLAIGGDDQTVRLLDAQGKITQTLGGLGGNVTAIAFSRGGEQLAIATANDKLSLWTVADGKPVATLEASKAGIGSLAYSSANGGAALLASAGKDGVIRLWDVKPNELKRLATVDPKTKKPPLPSPRLLKGHNGLAFVGGFSADGTELVSAGNDGSVRVWNVADGAIKRTFPQSTPITAMASDPATNTVAVALTNPSVVRLLRTDKGEVIQTLTHPKPARQLAFRPDGKQLATGVETTARVWDTQAGRLSAVIPAAASPLSALAFVGDNGVLVASEDKTVRRWETSVAWGKPTELGPFADRVIALGFSPDNKLLATGGGQPAANGEMKIWDVASRKPVREFKDAHSDTVFTVAFSPDGKLLASGSADKFIRIHDAATGKLVKSLEGHTHHVLSLDWKPDGKEIASGGADNLVKLWNYEAGEKIKDVAGASKQITAVQYTTKGDKVMAAGGDGQVRMLSSNGNVERTFSGAKDYLFCVAVTPDGTTLVSGGQEGKLFIWEVANGKLSGTLEPKP